MPNPSMNAPRIMIMAVSLGSVTSWIFVIVLLFTLTDIDSVISAGSPLLEMYYQATNSRTGATCMLLFNIGAMAFATQGLLMIASRVCFALARDRLFGPTSRPLSRVSDLWKVPTWSLVFCSVWIIIFGLICEFRTKVFSAYCQLAYHRTRCDDHYSPRVISGSQCYLVSQRGLPPAFLHCPARIGAIPRTQNPRARGFPKASIETWCLQECVA